MKLSSKKIFQVGMLLILICSGCTPTRPDSNDLSDQQGKIAVSGAFAMYPLLIRWAEEYQALNPGIQFDISAGGAGKGMADTLAGAVDIGMVSRPIYPQEQEQGAFWVPVAKDAVFLTVNAENPVLEVLSQKGIQKDTLKKIFLLGEMDTWGEVISQPDMIQSIHVYTRSDACGAADTWAKYLGGNQEDLQGIAVYGDPGLLKAIQDDPLGIGFNNLNYAYAFESGLPVEGVRVIPLDINRNGRVDQGESLDNKELAIQAVAQTTYPSPPARDLHLITRGKPEGMIKQFLTWTLTEGQRYLEEVGYIPVEESKLESALISLED